MHYHQALAVLSQLAPLFHIYDASGLEANRSQQSDETEIFLSQRAIFVMGWPLNHARTNANRKYQKPQQPILKREYDYAGSNPLHPVLQILKAWCRLCMQ